MTWTDSLMLRYYYDYHHSECPKQNHFQCIAMPLSSTGDVAESDIHTRETDPLHVYLEAVVSTSMIIIIVIITLLRIVRNRDDCDREIVSECAIMSSEPSLKMMMMMMTRLSLHSQTRMLLWRFEQPQ